MAALEDLVQAAMQGGKPGPQAGPQESGQMPIPGGHSIMAGGVLQPQAQAQGQAPPEAMPAPSDIMGGQLAGPQERLPAQKETTSPQSASLEPASREDADVIQNALAGDKPRWQRAMNRRAAGKLAGGGQ